MRPRRVARQQRLMLPRQRPAPRPQRPMRRRPALRLETPRRPGRLPERRQAELPRLARLRKRVLERPRGLRPQPIRRLVRQLVRQPVHTIQRVTTRPTPISKASARLGHVGALPSDPVMVAGKVGGRLAVLLHSVSGGISAAAWDRCGSNPFAWHKVLGNWVPR